MEIICYNEDYIDKSKFSIPIENRAFRYGDSFFETIKCSLGKPLFLKEHYFRIASSFCIMKMTHPLTFNIEKLEILIQQLLIKNKLDIKPARVRMSFFRSDGGYYMPKTNQVNFIIESDSLSHEKYQINTHGLQVGLYKDNLIPKQNLSNIKSNNRLLNVLASLYAKENNYDDCVLINVDKKIIECISGNLFIVFENSIKTPPLDDGCIDGVMRRVILDITDFNIEESSISLSDIFNAEEVFITNVIRGVQWVSEIDTNRYHNETSVRVLELLNKKYLV